MLETYRQHSLKSSDDMKVTHPEESFRFQESTPRKGEAQFKTQTDRRGSTVVEKNAP
jgi:hypothetical protein